MFLDDDCRIHYSTLVYCDNCAHLQRVDSDSIYAVCLKHNHVFKLWEEDTRRNYCSWAKKK